MRFTWVLIAVLGLVLGGCAQDYYLQPAPEDTGFQHDLWVDHFVQRESIDGTDVLWVVDYSGSMHDDQDRIASGIESMMGVLPEYGWKIHVVPMSPSNAADVDQIPLEPGDDGDDALDLVRHVEDWGAGHEKGMDAAIEFVDHNPYAWLNPDSSMLVVFVSDEPDSSSTDPDDFVDWLQATRPTSSVTAIVGLGNEGSCVSTYMTGDEYIEAANDIGGEVVDICSEDWSLGIQESVFNIEPYDSIKLSHIPSDPAAVTVFYDGVPVDGMDGEVWYYDGGDNTVYFPAVPPDGYLVEVVYPY